jgi:hypothetical protein
MSAKLILVAGATILSLALGSVGVAAVVPDRPTVEGTLEDVQIPRRFRARAYGAIESIDGGILAASTPAGPVDLVTDANTLFFADRERAALGDFAVGDVVGAVGWWGEEGGVFHAFAVAKLAEDRPLPVIGTLAEIDGDTLTVEIKGGLPVAVHVDAETVYRVRGMDSGLDDLEVGMHVVARGTLNPDGSLQAQVVSAAEAGPHQARLRGEVVDIEGTVLEIQTAGGTVNVLTDEDTVFRVPGVEGSGLDDVEVGDRIVAGGSWESESAFHAVGVGVVGGHRAGTRGAVRGRVIGIGEDNFVLGTVHGSLTVLVDEETRFCVPGVKDAGLDDIEAGTQVGVLGMWNEGEALQAFVVRVGGGRGR